MKIRASRHRFSLILLYIRKHRRKQTATKKKTAIFFSFIQPYESLRDGCEMYYLGSDQRKYVPPEICYSKRMFEPATPSVLITHTTCLFGCLRSCGVRAVYRVLFAVYFILTTSNY